MPPLPTGPPTAWRDRAERAGAPAPHGGDEFAPGASEWTDAVSRRRFLQLMGASLALAGLGGCMREPDERIVPYVDPPEFVVPGQPLFFATAFPMGGYAEGVLVESHEGRPTKAEGNPDHPASLGATTAWGQASVLDLYDPDRSQTVTEAGDVSTWEAFLQTMAGARARLATTGGADLRVLTCAVTSPTLADQLGRLLAAYPAARWHVHEPAGLAAQRAALGPVALRPHLDRAEVVLALDADFVLEMPGRVRLARDFMARRRVRAGQTAMSRLYAVESAFSLTGALADHRLPLKPSRLVAFAEALAARLGAGEAPAARLPEADTRWVEAVAADLQAHRGRALVLAGPYAAPAVQRLALRMNEALGALGTTLEVAAPVEALPPQPEADLAALTRAMAAGEVRTLLVLGANPACTAPTDVPFAEALARVPLSIHHGLHADETAARCRWHLPATHYLEAWSDARAFDGTASVQQPLIAPLYDACRSAHEVLEAFLSPAGRPGYALVRAFWQGRTDGDFDASWERALHDGVVGDRGSEIADRGSLTAPPSPISHPPSPKPPPSTDLELVIRPDPSVWDGRFATNGWLQELPKPMTKLTWGNAAHVSPALAARMGLVDGDVVALRYRGQTVEAPVLVQPGQADGAVTIHLGYGRERAGRVGTGVGFDAYRLRFSDAPWGGPGLVLRKTGRRETLATTQGYPRMVGRDLIRHADIGRFRGDPEFVHEGARFHELPTLYPEYAYTGYKWGMVIDTNVCTGCNACITACQAENNIPVVGKDEVVRTRAMQWLRVDRYYTGSEENPGVLFQPLPCQHCEHAPCELVCPVAATVHDSEGLNLMVYNRCIGTRYCSNNCPYKVRRFNFLQYADWTTERLKLQRNPDVTVRTRGVMEKCTYCVQRISAARIAAKNEGRRIRDGEVRTACQMACPTDAIVFGDLHDEAADVARLAAEPHDYRLLDEDLGTRPRTSYLAAFRNPNPAVPPPEGAPPEPPASL